MSLAAAVWWIAPVVSLAFVAAALARRGAGRLAPGLIAAVLAGGWNLIAWALLRRAMDGHAGAFESAFVQLAFGTIATFLFVVARMIAQRLLERRGK